MDVPFETANPPAIVHQVVNVGGSNWDLSRKSDTTPIGLTGHSPVFLVRDLPPATKNSNRDVSPGIVYFDTANANVSQQESKKLESLPRDISYTLVGHTDPRGTSDYNYNLAGDRVKSVATVMDSKGFQVTDGYSRGESETGHISEAEYGQARRVDIIPKY